MSSDKPSPDDAVSGFTRPEMYKENLAGTVDGYDRHIFLCYKGHKYWPPRIEASDADPLPKRVAATFKARKNDISLKKAFLCRLPFSLRSEVDLGGLILLGWTLQTKITVCEAREEAGFSDGDVLIFPEMIKYR
ncbi:unnamed protein product [Sphenostylis stenocarpa]|uniref:Uncharacterized protein n=1 Tax=Sphenostylis stenocarpa TaxID=92480 RepID=A0AA86V8F9_9FABA|nr:unnamed protein product [Sphenostylis stenocarpa]